MQKVEASDEIRGIDLKNLPSENDRACDALEVKEASIIVKMWASLIGLLILQRYIMKPAKNMFPTKAASEKR